MLPSSRIAIADSDVRSRSELATCLLQAGHTVVAQAASAAELVNGCRTTMPELIIADIQMPDLVGHAAARELASQFDLPVIAVSTTMNREMVESACCSRIFAHLLKPIREAELLAAIPLAVLHFQEFRALRK